MKCLVYWCCVVLCCQLVTAELPGVCQVTHIKTRVKHVLNRKLGQWVLISNQVPEIRRECCEGYRPRNTSRELTCDPVCEPECHNSVCEGVNLCVCLPGHMMINNSTSTCVNICDSCVNSACRHGSDSECVCDEGFLKDPTQPHVCDPVCDPPCVNATCVAPGVCTCFDNFVKDSNSSHECKPSSKLQCMFGDITDVDECSCYEGYMNDITQPNICVPVCKQLCENGFCAEPDSCRCYSGYKKSSESPYKCVPEIPETLMQRNCEFDISNAIRYDKASNCFWFKDKLVFNKSQCGFLYVMDDPGCSDNDRCGVHYRCSRMNKIGLARVHCDLLEVFEDKTVENSTMTIPDMDRTNITVELNALKLSDMNTGLNVTDSEWELKPASMQVCGQHSFNIVIIKRTTTVSTPSASSAAHSSNVLTLVVFVLSSLVLLMVVAGVGALLWIRHRRLTDPLNYRGETMRGYNPKPGEGDRPVELIADDESECEDADL